MNLLFAAASSAAETENINIPLPQNPGQSPLFIILCIALAVISIGLIGIILMQKKRASGLSATLSGTGDTYWGKNKGRSMEGTLEKYTKIGGALFLIVALLINIIL